MVYVEGYFLIHSFGVGFQLAQDCVKNGSVFAFNLSAVYVTEKLAQSINNLMLYCDIVIGNDREARSLVSAWEGMDVQDIEQVARIIASQPKHGTSSHLRGRKRIVFITRGHESLVVAESEGEDPSKVRVKYHEVIKTQVTGDTIGAGDAFAAGILYGVYSDVTIDEAVDFGLKYAAQSLKHRGCFIDE
jgi:adenosine kinase